MPSSSQGYSAGFVRAWILFGLIIFIIIVASPYILQRKVESEQARFMACEKGQRSDCFPSFIWIKSGWSLRDYHNLQEPVVVNADLSASSTPVLRQVNVPTTDETVRIVTTSQDKAPVISSVKPDGMTLVSHRYLAKGGTSVTLTAQITKAQSVQLWVIKHDPNGTPFPMLVSAMKKTMGDTYQASFKVDADLFGELEIRAQGTEAGQNTSLFVNVAATSGGAATP